MTIDRTAARYTPLYFPPNIQKLHLTPLYLGSRHLFHMVVYLSAQKNNSRLIFDDTASTPPLSTFIARRGGYPHHRNRAIVIFWHGDGHWDLFCIFLSAFFSLPSAHYSYQADKAGRTGVLAVIIFSVILKHGAADKSTHSAGLVGK